MKFGLLYEMQLPRPWKPDSEQQMFDQCLEEVQVADKLGYDYIWANEHHFTEEYSHAGAPEVFLAAAAALTRQIRIGHAVVLTAPAYNAPARVAERIGALDLVSHGRVEFGTGESASHVELGGFNIDPEEKRTMWREATEQIPNMLCMNPYPGFAGKYFSMPCRNIVPKPVQHPHPPLWLACSRRETIHMAARLGMGALTFAFVDVEEATKWRQEYYDIIKSDDCVPIGHSVNANIAMVTGFSMGQTEEEAKARGMEGFDFFGYSLGHYYLYGDHRPGRTNIWERYKIAREKQPDVATSSGIGTPQQVAEKLRAYADTGIDQMIFLQRTGKTRHEHILDSMQVFAEQVMPEFKAREAEREAAKQAELAPFVEAALARKQKMPPIAEADIPAVTAFGKAIAAGKAVYSDMPKEQAEATHHAAGGIAMFTEDYADESVPSAKEGEDGKGEASKEKAAS